MQTSTTLHRPSAAASDGSLTMTITNDRTLSEGEDEAGNPEGQAFGSLRLRGGPRMATTNKNGSKNKSKDGQRVAWNEDVVDNEGCGKKKSKICCIYHRPRRFDESSSSESESDSDSSCGHSHHHPHAGPSSSSDRPQSERDAAAAEVVREHERPADDEPNAYEKQPRPRPFRGKHKATS